MERIEIHVASVAAGVLAGLCVGGFLGYLLGRNNTRAWSQACIEDEVSAVRDHYRRHPPRPVLEDPESETSEEEEEGDLAEDDLEDEEGGDYWPPADRDHSKPYIISVVEFSDHEVGDGWEQIAATWYAEDNVLVDDTDKPIRDIKNTTGALSISRFKEGSVSGSPIKLYVRNEKLKVDFEIFLDLRSYSEGVHGYGNPRLPGE